ncbi:MAG: biotin transporter BioY [Lachnospiraceae bacterium]|uniref:biotin transporter BioY n=1 Tax=Parablautia sp. Marseille-Q6255 TaxID=3039593 RepID=UPI0024BC295A|nr:biotin transporter BioY [Parablautia sp. Marseille-Q6255]
MKMQRNSTKMLVLSGMFVAVLAVLSQLQIPMPSGVPVTLQTFAVALAGYVLGWKFGLVSTAAWILLGAVGAPVFSQFSGGVGVLVGATGGFIWGFPVMAACCGYGYAKKPVIFAAASLAGLAICHLTGVLQFSAVMGMAPGEAFLLASFPYLVKDVLSLVGAYAVAKAVRTGLRAAGVSLVSKA